MDVRQILETLHRLEHKIDHFIAPQEKDIFSVDESCKILGISRSKFDRYKNDGQIKTSMLGRQVKVHKSEIERIKVEGFKIR